MGSLEVSSSLFQPLKLGAVTLSHRVVQAPCTRMRSTRESDGVYVPNDLNVVYYAQRASQGGLMLTEATPISRTVCINLLLFGRCSF
jgi:2,4-dienoyl-CoA reductase-like NADH-dependent reductase (Old Yellow Enzyme family)